MSEQPPAGDRLAAIRQRRAAVPDGPWKEDIDFALIGDEDGYDEYNVGAVRIRMSASHTVDGSFKEATFIAHAPDDIDWLLAEVERLRGKLRQLEWAGRDGLWPCCPACHGHQHLGHVGIGPERRACWLEREIGVETAEASPTPEGT